jgi:Mor family transcriptional regulator
MYVIKTHDGAVLSIKQNDQDMIKKLAKKLELTAVTLVDGSVVYLSKGTVARIEKSKESNPNTYRLIDPPDYRGMTSPAKEKLRRKYSTIAKSGDRI